MALKTIKDWYIGYFQSDKLNVSLHIFLTILLFPIELFVFAYFSKNIYKCIEKKNYKMVARYIIYFIIVLAFVQLIHGYKSIIDNNIRIKIQVYIRENYLDTILNHNSQDINNPKIINEITLLPTLFYKNYDNILQYWIPLFALMFYFTIFIFSISRKYGIICLTFFTIFMVVLMYFFEKISTFATKNFDLDEELISEYENTINNNDTIRLYNTKDDELKKLKENEAWVASEKDKFTVYTNCLQYSLLVILCVFFIILFLKFYKELMAKKLNISKFIVFCSVLLLSLKTLTYTLSLTYKVISQNGNLKIITNLHDNFPIKETNEKFTPITNSDIELKNVGFHYEKNKYLFKNISLVIPFKSSVLIHGKNGNGKSTLAKIILGWLSPTEGQVLIGGKSISTFSKKQLTKLIFIMSQQNHLFNNKTVLENIFYPDPVPKNYKEFIQEFNLPNAFISILQTKIFKNGINISGGQKRLIHILRCFLNPAKIIILDEPLNDLDDDITKLLIAIIKKLQTEKTVIIISHIKLPLQFTKVINL